MATQRPEVSVQAIRLTNMHYDAEYQPVSVVDIDYQVDVLHRVPTASPDSMDILVQIIYREQNRADILLEAACVTTYSLLNVPKVINPTSGNLAVAIDEKMMHHMTTEAVAHARAVLAQHTAGTPFALTHIGFYDSEIVDKP